ncbi:MAG: NAD-dependent epimerase/dehydratase family protein [Bacteroides sp.]|nr:NAD-dependent epimerase/dehydratase family protein [Bacteroides sp.]MCM1550758.1 NAD-dependent epimerase/dehydratase family protein [Clostridium sp.]
MKRMLITGGTVFVSRYAAEYFTQKGNEVFVLNRNTRPQPKGVTLIPGDRNQLEDCLKGYDFDVVLDINSYSEIDIRNLLKALDNVRDYIFISSSAVYPETLPQPFREEQHCGWNSIWGAYGIQKLEAEQYLSQHVPQAYIIRPPYLYGPMQNIYREPFAFECARMQRPFFIPKDGSMKLQFFHVEDLCRFIEILLEQQPANHIFNVGNPDITDINQWVELCYRAAGAECKKIYVDTRHSQRSYFPFYDYEYRLDVSKQQALMPNTKSLSLGLRESYEWYIRHENLVIQKPYLEYINQNLL